MQCITRPPSICEICWRGPFSVHLGLVAFEPIRASRANGEETNHTGGYVYATSKAGLEAGLGAGCRFCRFVLAAFEKNYDGDDREGPLNIRVGTQPHWDGAGTPEGYQDFSLIINSQICLGGIVYTTADDPAAPYIVARNRTLDVGSPRTLALAKSYLEGCVRGHQRCVSPPSSPAPVLPARLLDCTDPDNPRLVATNGARGTYLALSYVWGEPQPHSTTTSNISSYLRRIDPSGLPQTIRDAIRVTHTLGFQYLWIDSLCIIQDSDEDKKREIGRMRLVYRDAYCTIIAASASRVGEGFLQDRPAIPYTEDGVFANDIPLPFICPSISGETNGGRASQQLGQIHISPIYVGAPLPSPRRNRRTQYHPILEPISSRGWTLQEYLMSPRSLVFASHTLQFRCQTSTLNVGGAYHDMDTETRLPDMLFLENPPLVEHSSKERAAIRNAWRTVVIDYTRRSITAPSDKLVGCGGVAEEFQRALRTDYLAGLWRDTLLGGLLWCKRVGAHIPRPAEYRAPSWSWAAVDGVVSPGAQDLMSNHWNGVAEVISCEVVLRNAELPFDRVTDGLLVLRTPLIACVWDSEKPGYLRRAPCSHELQDAFASPADGDVATLVNSRGAPERIGVSHLDSEDDANLKQIWAAPIHWRTLYLAGLMLAPVDTQGPEEKLRRFRRIGVFRTDFNSNGSTDWISKTPFVEVGIV